MPVVNRVAFTVFGQPVYWYGVVIAASMLAAAFTCMAREKFYRMPKDATLDLCLWLIPCALVGARLYYVAFTWDAYAGHPLKILDVRSGGMAIYGGIIGGALAGAIYARRRKIPFLRLADLVAPALALGQGLGRWGNYFNQEAFGVTVTNPAWQFFPMSVFIDADGAWHLATFFYESAWCVLLCVFLLIWERAAKKRFDGSVFFLYGLLYGLERAVVEGLRTDSLMWGPLRVSQIFSLLVALACAALYITKHNRRRYG